MKSDQPPVGEKIKAVILDCDGVMFDSALANRSYYDSVLAHFNMPPMNEEQFDFCFMHTGPQTFVHLFGEGDRLKEAMAVAKKMTYFPFVRLMRMEPFLMHLLTWLKPRYITAIATNRTDTMQAVMAEHGLNGLFDMVVTSVDVPKPKPDPGQLTKIMDAFSITGDQALYIGDSILDQKAAQAAGVCFAAYDNPDLSAAYHLDALVEVEDILGGGSKGSSG